MNPIFKIFSTYILILFFLLIYQTSFCQITVKYFNAEWNNANAVDWCHTDKKGLTDCKVYTYDIGKDSESQKEYAIVVVPTIIIFNGKKEVKRYQADVSFKMVATKKDIQDYIDELLMEDY